jgi:CheY-like chemotaxis protein
MAVKHKTKIMMLDDEKFLLEMFKLTFEKHGYDVAIFSDVDDALTALRKGYEPEVMLFDITMPDSRSGYEFIETVKAEKLAKHSFKIAFTNQGLIGEKERLAELGADAHLLKVQYAPAELVGKIEELLAERK